MKENSKKVCAKIILFAALALLTIIGDIINFEAAMFFNRALPLNIVSSVAVGLGWMVFLIYANLFVLNAKERKMVARFLFSMLVLIPVAYIMSLTLILHSVGLVIILIPDFLILIPFAGLIIPITELLEQVIPFDFMIFAVGMLVVLILAGVNQSLNRIRVSREG